MSPDYYLLDELLTDEARDVRDRVRAFVDSDVLPVINDYWDRAEFPWALVPKLAGLGVVGSTIEGYGCPGLSRLAAGMVTVEMSRGDGSVNTFLGVQSGLAMGSINLLGSDEQKQRWLPGMATLDLIGAFALTEPDHGSDSVALETSVRRDGDAWVLNGAKRWIGNATFSDITIIWAKDVEDGQVKGFIVPTSTPGYSATKIEGKISLRPVQNADITLDHVRVPESLRLQRANSFRDTASVLRLTRAEVAWAAVGTSIGAYEAAVRYAGERVQFGRTIGSHQLIQDLLVKCLGNITASIGMVVRVSEMLDAGEQRDEHSALAKAYATSRMRETVAWAREAMGGNGIVLEHEAARFFADAEALYSYEGTREMNTLIVGRKITGTAAFV